MCDGDDDPVIRPIESRIQLLPWSDTGSRGIPEEDCVLYSVKSTLSVSPCLADQKVLSGVSAMLEDVTTWRPGSTNPT
jgi:hypothetical protein